MYIKVVYCHTGIGSPSDGQRSALKQAFRSRILRKQAKMKQGVNQVIQALKKSQPMTLDNLEQRTTDALNKLFDDFTKVLLIVVPLLRNLYVQ